jgi:septation ring formation regulator EzrA
MEENATKKDIQDVLAVMQSNQESTKKDIQDVLAVMQSNQESTKKDIQDVLEITNTFASNVDEKFETIDRKFDHVNKKLETIEHRLSSVESQMVTKAYLDDKLADTRGDLSMYDRKQDKKVDFLTQTLAGKKVLTSKETDAIVAMSPFPQPPRVS